MSKLLKLWFLKIIQAFNRPNRFVKISSFSKQAIQAMKLWNISSYIIALIGLQKIFLSMEIAVLCWLVSKWKESVNEKIFER